MDKRKTEDMLVEALAFAEEALQRAEYAAEEGHPAWRPAARAAAVKLGLLRQAMYFVDIPQLTTSRPERYAALTTHLQELSL